MYTVCLCTLSVSMENSDDLHLPKCAIYIQDSTKDRILKIPQCSAANEHEIAAVIFISFLIYYFNRLINLNLFPKSSIPELNMQFNAAYTVCSMPIFYSEHNPPLLSNNTGNYLTGCDGKSA